MKQHANIATVRHGGDIQNAIKHFGSTADDWLDLSTGISPWNYPITDIDDSVWRELPASITPLIEAASSYYQCDKSHIVCTPGSQLAIRLIPQLLEQPQSVAIPVLGYQEHAASWKLAGHSVITYHDHQHLTQLVNEQRVKNAVVINPNNPSCELLKPEHLQDLSESISGILLIDEAFSDINKSNTIYSQHDAVNRNIVVLKSIGKFFGLAGARVGFAIGEHPILHKLNQILSPWSLSGVSMKLATLALLDTQWQQLQRQRIGVHAQKQQQILDSVLVNIPNCECHNQGLFFSIFGQNETITQIHTQLAKQKIWSRLGDSFISQDQQRRNWLRLSLAGDGLARLSFALQTIESTLDNQNRL